MLNYKQQKRKPTLTHLHAYSGDIYSHKLDMDVHVFTKLDIDRVFSCEVCKFHSESLNAIRQHMDYHVTVYTYTCIACSRYFKCKNIANQHAQESHLGQEAKDIVEEINANVGQLIHSGADTNVCGVKEACELLKSAGSNEGDLLKATVEKETERALKIKDENIITENAVIENEKFTIHEKRANKLGTVEYNNDRSGYISGTEKDRENSIFADKRGSKLGTSLHCYNGDGKVLVSYTDKNKMDLHDFGNLHTNQEGGMESVQTSVQDMETEEQEISTADVKFKAVLDEDENSDEGPETSENGGIDTEVNATNVTKEKENTYISNSDDIKGNSAEDAEINVTSATKDRDNVGIETRLSFTIYTGNADEDAKINTKIVNEGRENQGFESTGNFSITKDNGDAEEGVDDNNISGKMSLDFVNLPENKVPEHKKLNSTGNRKLVYNTYPLQKKDPKVVRNSKLTCEVCHKTLSCTSVFKSHVLIHEGIKPYKCETCGRSFRKKDHLRDHEETHNESRKRDFECKICQKRFMGSRTLKSHMKTHSISSDVRKFTCNICQKSFRRNSHLKEHSVVHDNNRPILHSCFVCNKDFKSRSAYRAHMKGHTSVKPFQCQLCGVSYKKNEDLIAHEKRSHNNKNPFQCNICSRSFTRKESLQKHMPTHEERTETFACNVCNKSYTTPKSLKSHMNLHKRSGSFHCGNCNKSWSQKNLLKKHIMKCHTKQLKEIAPTEEEDRQGNQLSLIVEGAKIEVHFNGTGNKENDTNGPGEKRISTNEVKHSAIVDDQLDEDEEPHLSLNEKSTNTDTSMIGSEQNHKDFVRRRKNHKRKSELSRVCSICGSKFTSAQAQIRHMKYLHGERKTFMCEYCGISYSWPGHLQKHVLREHPEKH